jgi:hypothetical protein
MKSSLLFACCTVLAILPLSPKKVGLQFQLMLVYQFEIAQVDAMGENLAQSLATPAFEQDLNRLEQATALATGHQVAHQGDLTTGAWLTPVMTLRNGLKQRDPAGYYGPLQSPGTFTTFPVSRRPVNVVNVPRFTTKCCTGEESASPIFNWYAALSLIGRFQSGPKTGELARLQMSSGFARHFVNFSGKRR